MTAKNPLTKFRNRPSSNSSGTQAPSFSFRFNPAEEDLLEEYTTSEITTLTPLQNANNEAAAQATSGVTEPVEEVQASFNLSASSSQSEVGSQTPQSEKSSRDASPLKETFKEYFPKVGKRSASLDYSSDGERWSFSGIKGRIAKRFEEIGKDAPGFAGSLYRGDKQKLRESFSSNGVTDTITEHTIADNPTSKSFSSRSRSSLDVRAGIDDEPAVKKERDRSFSVEEGIDCTSEENTQNAGEFPISDLKSNPEPTSTPLSKESSQSVKRSSVGLVTGAQALLTRNKSPKLSSKVLTSQTSLPTDYVSLSSLKSTPSFESELLTAEEMDDFATWEFVNSEVASEEKPETPLVFERQIKSNEEPRIKKPKNLFGKLMAPVSVYMPTKKNGFKLHHPRRNTSIALLVVFIGLHLVPISSYWVGLMTGFLLSYIVGSLLWFILQPSPAKMPLEIPDYQNLPPLRIPVSNEDKESSINKGWMNELATGDYDPENYHMNCTHSVYVRLEGIQLRLSRPKVNIPKRAMWNESKINAVFVRQRHFNIKGAKISLPPEGLVRKRLWSKKYPICVIIPSEAHTLGSTNSWPVIHSVIDEDEAAPVPSTNSEDEKPTNSTTLYLFARTCREKEEWFRRFQAASVGKTLVQYQKDYYHCALNNLKIDETLSSSIDNIEKHTRDSAESNPGGPGDYLTYMARFVSQDQVAQNLSNIRNSVVVNSSLPVDGEKTTVVKEISTGDMWLNALIGRLFYDFLTHQVWSEVVAEKIQRKLSVIRVPYFMDELKLRDIDLGGNLPFLQRSSPPMIDERGLWIDFDLTYKGSFQMTLETKLNLMRLKKDLSVDKSSLSASIAASHDDSDIETHAAPPQLHSSKSIYNSDEEDSAESSTDEDVSFVEAADHSTEDGIPPVPSSPSLSSSVNKANTSKKLLHWVDKITQSKYFQQATEIGYIKKKMAEVSKTPMILTVEVKGLIGTLVLNVPPPPSDRLWYGFRGNPQLSLTARPKLGEHVVTITHVTEWIEKKLRLEFQKLLVMPNMDDLIIPIMESALSRRPTKNSQH